MLYAFGAGDGNRTRLLALGRPCSTDELHLHQCLNYNQDTSFFNPLRIETIDDLQDAIEIIIIIETDSDLVFGDIDLCREF